MMPLGISKETLIKTKPRLQYSHKTITPVL